MRTVTCATCAHCRNPGQSAQCRAPQNIRPVSLLTGFEEYFAAYCSTARTDATVAYEGDRCGVAGAWWVEGTPTALPVEPSSAP